jgi:spore coat protein A
MVQVATDQGLLPAPVTLSTVELAMGERIEVIIDFSPYAIGSRLVLLNQRGNGSLRRIMRFDVVRKERDDSRVPERLAAFEPLQPSRAIRTRTFVFGGRLTLGVPPGVKWVINGKPFDPARIDANPRLGDVELWRFVNQPFMGRTMLHPVHNTWRRFRFCAATAARSCNRSMAGRIPLPSRTAKRST